MPYSINRYSETTTITVEDGTVNSQLDIKLIGKNYAGYGELQNENFVHLLENFSGTGQPPKPISGQLWYDSGLKKLKFYNGLQWKTTGGAEVSASSPTGLATGDFWFDNINNQLWVWNQTDQEFILVGPQGVAGQGTTQMRSRSVKDTLGGTHAIIEAVVDEATIYIISNDDTFTLNSTLNSIDGFNAPYVIKKGITLAYTNSAGISASDYSLWGTVKASNGMVIGGTFYSASSFIRSGSAAFAGGVTFDDSGFTLGNDADVRFSVVSGTTPTIANQLPNGVISFKVTDGSTTFYPLNISASASYAYVKPAVGDDNKIYLGASNAKFNTVYASTFEGNATKAASLQVGSDFRTASVAAGNNTVAIRTDSTEPTYGGGALKATYFIGTATAAQYADLAEKYLADTEYEVGTVLMVGGDKEVTACQVGTRAIGPVSANPAYMMNSELEGGTYIALKGRVPVKVTGPVIKGQRLVAGLNGTAQAAFGNNADAFAIALETNNDVNTKLVEAIII
jgi:hypothetical protein